MLERGTQDPRVRTAAASALVAGGALAAAKVVRDHTGERRRPKPEAYRFGADETPAEGIGRIASGQLDLTIRLLEEAPGEDDGGKAVHEARKALKRTRALLRLSRGTIDQERYRQENVVLRDVGRTLSQTRDAQVLLDTLDGLTARYGERLRADTWSRLRQSLAQDAEQSGTVGSRRAEELLGTLSDARARVESWQLPQDSGPGSLAGGFARVYRRGRRAYAAASSHPDTETLHELRKRAKDLWHSGQLLKPVGPNRMKQLRRSAHRISDLLGDDHDLTILREHAARQTMLLSEPESELLIALIDHRQRVLRDQALTLAAEVYRPKPKKLLRQLKLA